MQKINQLVKAFDRNLEIDTETASQTDEMPNVRPKTETLLASLDWIKAQGFALNLENLVTLFSLIVF